MYHFFKNLQIFYIVPTPISPVFSRDDSHRKAAKPCRCIVAFLVFSFCLVFTVCFVARLTYPRLIPGRVSTRTEVSILQSSLETSLSPKLWSSISGYPKTLSRGLCHHRYFYNYTQMLFTFLSSSHECAVESARGWLPDV